MKLDVCDCRVPSWDYFISFSIKLTFEKYFTIFKIRFNVTVSSIVYGLWIALNQTGKLSRDFCFLIILTHITLSNQHNKNPDHNSHLP